MGAKVILPNFTLPGQGPHPAVRALWVSGGLLVVATLVLGAAVWHRHTINRVVAAVASAKALAPVEQPKPLAAAETVRPAAPAAAAAEVAGAAVVTVAPSAAAETPAPVPARHRHRHHAHGGRSAHRKTVAVRGSSDETGSRKSSAKNDDALDRLLKQFK
jgi:hypothetical protein